jgi:hypothetical protein
MNAEAYHKMLLVRFQRRLERAKADYALAKSQGHHGQAKVLKDEVYDLDRGLQYIEAWTPWFIEQFEKQEVPNA